MLSAIPAHPLLGRAVSEHQGRLLAGGWLIYLGGILVAAGLLQAPAIVTSLIDDGESSALPLAAGTFVVGALLLFLAVRMWRQSVVVYEHGFVWSRMGSAQTVRWDEIVDIQGLQERSASGVCDCIGIRRRDGKVVVLTDALSDMHRLQGYLTHQTRALP